MIPTKVVKKLSALPQRIHYLRLCSSLCLLYLHQPLHSPGGELLHSLTRQSYYTEYDIAHYIRQLLSGLDYMHRLSIAHLGLTPGDLLVAHPGGRHLLLTDFGLSRRITSFGKLNPLEYGE
jgi:Serine/threonine protein kinase